MAAGKMEQVVFQKDYKLNILLDDGSRILYDLQPKLVTARFQELSNWSLFIRGRLVDGRRICWTALLELTLDEILLNVRHHGK